MRTVCLLYFLIIPSLSTCVHSVFAFQQLDILHHPFIPCGTYLVKIHISCDSCRSQVDNLLFICIMSRSLPVFIQSDLRFMSLALILSTYILCSMDNVIYVVFSLLRSVSFRSAHLRHLHLLKQYWRLSALKWTWLPLYVTTTSPFYLWLQSLPESTTTLCCYGNNLDIANRYYSSSLRYKILFIQQSPVTVHLRQQWIHGYSRPTFPPWTVSDCDKNWLHFQSNAL